MNVIAAPDLTAITAVTAAIGMGIYGVFQQIAKQRAKARERVAVDKAAKVAESVNEVKAQFQTNGGFSAKDQLNRIEDALRWLSGRTKMISDASGAMAFRCDKNGYWTDAASSLLSLVNLPLSHVLDNGWTQFIHEDDRDRV